MEETCNETSSCTPSRPWPADSRHRDHRNRWAAARGRRAGTAAARRDPQLRGKRRLDDRARESGRHDHARGGERRSDRGCAATIHAEDGGGADAQALLGLIEIEVESNDGDLDIFVSYPVDRYDRFHYPSEGGGTTRTTARYQDERIVVTSDDDAVKVWVDFVIRVPQGVSAEIENIAGNVTANSLGGDLLVDTHAGHVIVDGGTGDVEVDTGSGDVRVSNRDGDVSADTGSGDITVSGVEGRSIEVDTGSGEVRLERVSGSLTADTGSGDIEAVDLQAGAVLSADTGSGDVRLSGDMSQVEEIEIDTGSGDVDLNMSAVPGMRITIDTGNGSINVDLPNLRTLTSRRTFFRGEVGDGSARVDISTGNGNVRIRAR